MEVCVCNDIISVPLCHCTNELSQCVSGGECVSVEVRVWR